MKWTRYQNKAAYQADDLGMRGLGEKRTGKKWSDAPRGEWAVADDEPGKVVLVRRRPGTEFRYELIEDH